MVCTPRRGDRFLRQVEADSPYYSPSDSDEEEESPFIETRSYYSHHQSEQHLHQKRITRGMCDNALIWQPGFISSSPRSLPPVTLHSDTGPVSGGECSSPLLSPESGARRLLIPPPARTSPLPQPSFSTPRSNIVQDDTKTVR